MSGWVVALALMVVTLFHVPAPVMASGSDFISAAHRYIPLRNDGITVIIDRYASVSDALVEHFEPHQLQNLQYCGTDPACTQDARDAGAAYHASLSVDGQEVRAFYDGNGVLVGIANLPDAFDGLDDGASSGDGDGTAGDDPLPGDLVGSLAGEFDVSGSANYRIPLDVPPSFGGLEPQLSLRYGSNTGNGALGVGWRLSGLDSITRCRRTIALDGASRSVQLDGGDRFCLKGKRLVAVSGDYGEDGTAYRTRIASFVRVESRGQSGSGPESFRVRTKAGETLYFGETPGSRVADGSGTVLTWSLRRIVDAAGNVMLVNYENTDDGHRPVSIEYSEVNPGQHDFVHKVAFQWESRPDAMSGYVAGMKRRVTRRLSGVRMETNGERVRRYILGYRNSESTERSLLASIQLCARTDDDCLPPTTFDWHDPDRGLSNVYRNRTGVDDDWNSRNKRVVFFDYDGDGDSDMLVAGRSNANENPGVYRTSELTLRLNKVKLLTNDDGNFTSEDVRDWFDTDAVDTNYAVPPRLKFQPLDSDGDGRQELAVFGIPYGDIDNRASRGIVIDWNGSGFSTRTLTGDTSPKGQLLALDLNGDGRQTLLSVPEQYCPSIGACEYETAYGTIVSPKVRPSPQRFDYIGGQWHSNGLGAMESIVEVTYNGDDPVPQMISPIDSDGDGVAELIVQRKNSSTFWLKPEDDGQSFTQTKLNNRFGMSKGAWYPNRRVLVPLDFNGDGNQDLLLQRKGSNNSATYLILSNGAGFEDRINITDKWGMSGGAWNADKRKAVPHDFNGDGLRDLLLQGRKGKSTHILVSEGDRFRRHSGGGLWNVSDSKWDLDGHVAQPLSHDGDRVADLALVASGDSKSWLLRDRHDDPDGTVVDRITGISEGPLRQYALQYELAGHTDGYQWSGGASGYPERNLRAGFAVVTRSRSRNGTGGWRSVDYEYKDLRVHQKGHGVLGFAQIRQTDQATGRLTIMDMHNSDPRLAGMVDRTRVKLDGQLIRSVDNDYAFAGNQPAGVHFPYLERSTKDRYALDGAHLATVTTETSGYDAWENVGRVRVVTTDHVHGQTWEQITDNTWDTSTPETGRLLASQVTHVHPDGSTIVRGSSFEYDAVTGMLSSETVQPGGPAGIEQTTTYERDRWGNKATTTVSGGILSDPDMPAHLREWPDRVTSRATEIDLANGLRRVTVTNAAGHTETRSHRLSDGAVVSRTGPNGLTTNFEYDPLGREVRAIRPDGTETTIDRQWGAHPDAPEAVYSVTEDATGEPSETVWYDRLEREVVTSYPGFDGRRVREIQEYNSRGAVARTSRPHFAGGTRHWIEFTYDARGRVIERDFPLGEAAGGGRATTTTSYDGYVTTVTDAEGRTKSKERNARDQLVRATDALGETVTYRYNAVGDLVETTDPLGRSTTFVYDDRGRKTRMTAPDMGTWSYVYNGFGELIAQTDAKGQMVHIDYDRLGRKIRRDEPEGVTHWCYDGDGACGTIEGGYGAAVGKLVEVTGPSADYRKTIQYDALGRRETTTTWHLGEETEAFPVTVGYDSKGRVGSTVYPEGFTLYNDYNPDGYLVRKISPRDSVALEFDSSVVEAERMTRLIARYEAKAADYRAHATIYERMANDYAASGDPEMASNLDNAAQELRDHAAELDQAAADKQAELDALNAETNADEETLRVRFGPDGDTQVEQDVESAAARAESEAWLDTAEEHLARAEQAELDGLIELRDQELALAQNAIARAREAASEADTPDPGDDPTVGEMVPQGAGPNECVSNDLYEVFWCAESADAEGRINKLHYGNGLVTHRGYETASGQLAGIRTVAAGDAGVVRQDLSYNYDAVNNVTRRDNLVTGIAQDYAYDDNDRLTQAQVSLDPFGDGTETSTYNWTYDAMGNRVSDSRTGTYGYADPSNPGRLTAAGGDPLTYDANGNVTAHADKGITWSSFDKPVEIEQGDTTVQFAYGADRSRYRRHESRPDGTREITRYVGKAFERTVTVESDGSSTTEDRYFIYAAGRLVSVHTENRTTSQARNRFLHRDALGSVTLVTDAMGEVVERYAFRPFGERAVLENGDNAYTGVALADVTPDLKRGFTGHEHIDGLGLVHMNGRVYDPALGRLLSADPNVQFVDEPRGYNRYAYVQSNPLKYSDPSGYFLSGFAPTAFLYVPPAITLAGC